MKIIAIGQFLFVLMACSVVQMISNSLYGNETDRLSLLEFKKAIRLDPQQALMSWNESTYFCSWEGVLCRMRSPHRVISLNLTNRGLVGQISPSLGNLTFLRHLHLPINSFTGEIPPSLGHLHHLQTLYLSNNSLQGMIPNLANCSNLTVLELYRNNLVGQFPEDLPHRLQRIQLSYNNLTGHIPASLSNISTLNQLLCVSNNFIGNIPDEFAMFPVLQTLYVGGNKIGGGFPEAIFNLSTLLRINIAFSDLSGKISPNLGNSLPNLELLQLDYNFFQGNIPYSLVNASNLYELDISSNNFTGAIPNSIGKLFKLSWLNLEFNELEARSKQDWGFMISLANCTELEILSIAYNHLEGRVPNSLGNLSVHLLHLFLGNNKLSGGFPSGIKNLPNLVYLGLEANQFTGVVPNWLGSLNGLQGIDFDKNKFTGFIPASFANLSQLGFLYLGSNKFSDQIPPSLGKLQMLQVLSIFDNNLHGSIPEEIFSIPSIMRIELSFNNLDGQLHADIGKAKQLTKIQLSSNKIFGEIPNTLGDCESLESIEFDSNLFSGNIPASVGLISGLKVINFSHNNLTGPIPSSLGNLSYLEQLDLSFNHLSGEIPEKGIFKNGTALRIEGNNELCGGPPDLHLRTCSIMASVSSKHKKSIILKVIIPVVSILSLIIAITIVFLSRRKLKKQSLLLPSFGIEFPKVSFNELARATESFSTSNLIGRGRFSSVYLGKLIQDNNVVAVKVFSLETRGAHKSFIAECNALRNVRHRNLVPSLTACSSIDSNGNDFKALVYKFMPQGDLHKLLYSTIDDDETSNLNLIRLAKRISIVVDVSDALEYLHHSNQGTIVHCDLKPSNILLDDNMVAHVGDFGLARFKIDPSTSLGDSNSISSLAIKGTIGYVAPECAVGGQVSTASDVYSFGVILLEIFIRRRPTDDMFQDGLTIAKYAEINFPDRILEIVDPQLQEELVLCQETPITAKEKGVHCLRSMLNIGLCCTKPTPSERISMQEAAAKLHGIKDAYLTE
uniref:Receptor kinase-like protein Xa21 n=1 Tax=Oryza meridionalis TaxID=40149 RepID=A0A0E0F302_9ORYZ